MTFQCQIEPWTYSYKVLASLLTVLCIYHFTAGVCPEKYVLSNLIIAQTSLCLFMNTDG